MKRVFEGVAFSGFAILMSLVAWRTIGLVDGLGDWVVVLLAAAAGVALTDLISGLVHWACDTYGTAETPLLGSTLIQPFREHHDDPGAMTRRPWLEVNHNNCLGALILLTLAPWPEATAAEGTLFGGAFLFFLAGAIYLTNTFHKWSHQQRISLPGSLLQRLHLVIGPDQHDRHHETGYGAYCITSGWLNAPLDRARFFPALERVLASIGAYPDKDRVADEYRRQSPLLPVRHGRGGD